MNSIAIIVARGGSKRIPRKNIKEFCGRPIISYVVDSAIQSGVFDDVMVSTDDHEIAEVAQKYGAKIPFFRTSETAQDESTVLDTLLEVFSEFDKKNETYTHACCLYPTAVFVTPELLQKSMAMLKSDNLRSVIPVIKFGYPIQRALLIRGNILQYREPEFAFKFSHQLEATYHDAGQFFGINVEMFRRDRVIVGSGTKPVILSEMDAQDIDTIEDWNVAEFKWQLKINPKSAKRP